MAKRKTARKTNNKTTFGDAIGLNYIFDNTITDFFLGLLTVAIAVVMIIAMCSYLSTGATDQSMLENLRAGEWVNTGQEFRNGHASDHLYIHRRLIDDESDSKPELGRERSQRTSP